MGTSLCSNSRRFLVDFASVRAVLVKVRRDVKEAWFGMGRGIVVVSGEPQLGSIWIRQSLFDVE